MKTALRALAALRARIYFRHATLHGTKIQLHGRPRVSRHGTIIIHDKVLIDCRLKRSEFEVDQGATLEIGERTFINHGCSISATERVTIGADGLIGDDVSILDNDFHHLEPHLRKHRPPSEPVEIGDNVWLGTRAMILKGVTIGNDAVVAAGSIVTTDVAAGSLVAGSPAAHIKDLYDL